MTDLQKAIEALADLVDNFAPPKGENYYWDQAREVVAEYEKEHTK
jgi:hypothetical protein